MNHNAISRWFIAASLLCTIPVLYPTYPPMVDLPQHVASIMVLDQVHFGHYRFAELFEFNWLRPYWIGYVLIWALSYLVGLIWASKLVIACAVVGLVWSLAFLRREVNAPPMLDWLFLAVPFGFAYDWGFVNFLVCAPLGPLFLVYYHRFLQGRSSSLAIMAWVVVLVMGHLLMVAFFCMAASAMALRGRPAFPALVRRILPMTISIPIGLSWFLMNLEPRNVENAIEWGSFYLRVIRFLPDLFSLEYGLSQILMAAFLVALPFLLGVKPRWQLATIMPPVFYLLFMMLAPALVFDNLGTYERFNIFGLMFLALMLEDAEIRPPEMLSRASGVLMLLPVILGLAMITRVGLRAYGFEQEAADFHRMMRVAEAGKRGLSLVQYNTSAFSRAPVFMHFPVWYQVEKKGLVDFNFAEWTSLNSVYKPEHRSGIDSRLAWFPGEFDWQHHHGDHYDYFIVSGSPEFAAYVFRNDADKITLRYEGRNWFLFERIQ